MCLPAEKVPTQALQSTTAYPDGLLSVVHPDPFKTLASSVSKPCTGPVLPQRTFPCRVVLVVLVDEVVVGLVDVLVVVAGCENGCNVRNMRKGHEPAAAFHGLGCAL